MKVKKRNGNLEKYNLKKIRHAIERAFEDIYGQETYTEDMQVNIDGLASATEVQICKVGVADVEDVQDVEDIQDAVEDVLMLNGYYEVAKEYIRYRYLHELRRQMHNDNEFLSLINGNNEYWNTENSNKNAEWVTTQRDYLAGIVSKDIARTYIFPKEAIEAHDAGIIHIHE